MSSFLSARIPKRGVERFWNTVAPTIPLTHRSTPSVTSSSANLSDRQREQLSSLVLDGLAVVTSSIHHHRNQRHALLAMYHADVLVGMLETAAVVGNLQLVALPILASLIHRACEVDHRHLALVSNLLRAPSGSPPDSGTATMKGMGILDDRIEVAFWTLILAARGAAGGADEHQFAWEENDAVLQLLLVQGLPNSASDRRVPGALIAMLESVIDADNSCDWPNGGNGRKELLLEARALVERGEGRFRRQLRGGFLRSLLLAYHAPSAGPVVSLPEAFGHRAIAAELSSPVSSDDTPRKINIEVFVRRVRNGQLHLPLCGSSGSGKCLREAHAFVKSISSIDVLKQIVLALACGSSTHANCIPTPLKRTLARKCFALLSAATAGSCGGVEEDAECILSRTLHALPHMELVSWASFLYLPHHSDGDDRLSARVASQISFCVAASLTPAEFVARVQVHRCICMSLPPLLLLHVVSKMTSDAGSLLASTLNTRTDLLIVEQWAQEMEEVVRGCVRRSAEVKHILDNLAAARRLDEVRKCGGLMKVSTSKSDVWLGDKDREDFLVPQHKTKDILQTLFGSLASEYAGARWERFAHNGGRQAVQGLYMTYQLTHNSELEHRLLSASSAAWALTGRTTSSVQISPRQFLIDQAENGNAQRPVVLLPPATLAFNSLALASTLPGPQRRRVTSRRLEEWMSSATTHFVKYYFKCSSNEGHVSEKLPPSSSGGLCEKRARIESMVLLAAAADEFSNAEEKQFAAYLLRSLLIKEESTQSNSSNNKNARGIGHQQQVNVIDSICGFVVDTTVRSIFQGVVSATAAAAVMASSLCQQSSWEHKALGHEAAKKLVLQWVQQLCLCDLIIGCDPSGNGCKEDVLRWYSALLLLSTSRGGDDAQKLTKKTTMDSRLVLPIPAAAHKAAIRHIFAANRSSWSDALCALTHLDRQLTVSTSSPGMSHQEDALPREALAELLVQLVSRRVPIPKELRARSSAVS